MKAVYLGNSVKGVTKCLKYFICGIKEDDKATVTVDNVVVGKGAFKSAPSVENVQFEKCELIEESAFENCADLKNAFWVEENKECPKTYEFSGGVKNSESNNEESEKGDTPRTDSIFGIRIPNVTILEIQRGAFKNCASLQTVILPKSTKIVIEKDSFGGCQNLRTIVFPCVDKQELVISEEAFVGCSKMIFACSKQSAASRYAREHCFEIVNIEG